MFGSIFGVYRLLIASTMALYGHGRGVVWSVKICQNFVARSGLKNFNWFLRRNSTERLYSCLFFLPNSNSELKKMLSMMVSPPMPLEPHTSRMKRWWYEYLEVNTIGYGYPAGFARNCCLWGVIILTSRYIKWSYFTQFTSTMSMLGIIHSGMHNNFTSYIHITNLVHLIRLEMINSSLFYWLCAVLLVVMEMLLWHSF